MTADPGRRQTPLSDPTAERISDPVPVGDDVMDHDATGEDITSDQDEEDPDQDDAQRPR